MNLNTTGDSKQQQQKQQNSKKKTLWLRMNHLNDGSRTNDIIQKLKQRILAHKNCEQNNKIKHDIDEKYFFQKNKTSLNKIM